MTMNEKFNDILNECLDRIIKGETVESCLKTYSELAKELEPLLKTAQSARVVATLKARPEFKARARIEFQSALRDFQDKKARQRFRFFWHWQPAWSIAIATVVVIIIANFGMVFVAGRSMPNDLLYSLKIATENVQLALTPSDLGKAELNARFADRRVDEIIEMTSAGAFQEVLVAANNLSINTSNMANIAGADIAEGVYSIDRAVADASSESSQESPKIMLGEGTPETTSKVPNGNDTAPVPSLIARSTLEATSVPPQVAPASKGIESTSQSLSVVKNARALELEKVREIITSNYVSRQARLEEVLGKVTVEMRPLILQALDQSTFEYEKAIRNIEIAGYVP